MERFFFFPYCQYFGIAKKIISNFRISVIFILKTKVEAIFCIFLHFEN